MNTPQPTEFVYGWYEDMDGQEPGKWWAQRVLKRTKEFVYIQYIVGGYLSKHPSRETRKLRRKELDEKGSVWWRGSRTWGERYYNEEGKRQFDLRQASYYYVPECLKVFGLTKDATIEDVKRAYHEAALKEHPDTGGTHEGFLKLQEHYQYALRMVQS